jgi:hypothetical protein
VSRLFKTRSHRSRLIDNRPIIWLDHREYLIIWHEAMIIHAFARFETFLFVEYNHAMIKWSFFNCSMNLIQIEFSYKKTYSLSWIQKLIILSMILEINLFERIIMRIEIILHREKWYTSIKKDNLYCILHRSSY